MRHTRTTGARSRAVLLTLVVLIGLLAAACSSDAADPLASEVPQTPPATTDGAVPAAPADDAPDPDATAEPGTTAPAPSATTAPTAPEPTAAAPVEEIPEETQDATATLTVDGQAQPAVACEMPDGSVNVGSAELTAVVSGGVDDATMAISLGAQVPATSVELIALDDVSIYVGTFDPAEANGISEVEAAYNVGVLPCQ